jgi:hypothetical protein
MRVLPLESKLGNESFTLGLNEVTLPFLKEKSDMEEEEVAILSDFSKLLEELTVFDSRVFLELKLLCFVSLRLLEDDIDIRDIF